MRVRVPQGSRRWVLGLAFGLLSPWLQAAEPVRGTVYLDRNGNGRREADEPGLPGLRITDGVDSVTSGPDGAYTLVPTADPMLARGGVATLSLRFPSGHWPTTPWFYRIEELGTQAADFGLRPQAQPLPFTFVHGTDAHVPRAGKARLQDFRHDLQSLRDTLAFCVLTGDLTDGSDSHPFDQARQEYDFLGQELGRFPVPVFCLPGNHDFSGVNAKPAWETGQDRRGYGFFTRTVGPLRWSFDYADIHFVGVDFIHPLPENKWGWGAPSSAVQWLERDLRDVPAGRRIFLFVHAPLTTNGLAEVVAKYPITQIFHGHDHQDQARRFAGVPTLSSGSLAQVFEDADRSTGYRVVRVTATGLESFYRTTGEPHAVALDAPRKPADLKTGQRVRGNLWDPAGQVRQLALRLGDQEQIVPLAPGTLWRPFEADLTLAVPPGGATNLLVCARTPHLAWRTTVFDHGRVALSLFEMEPTRARLTEQDAQTRWVGPGALEVATGHRERWPGITLKVAEPPCDLSSYQRVSLAVKNLEPRPLTVYARLDNPGADGTRHCLNGSVTLPPGGTGELWLSLNPTPWRLADPVELVGMRAAPGKSEHFDAKQVTQLLVFLHEPKEDARFELGPVQVSGRVYDLPAQSFFPFIDELGQFIHADWTGKTESFEDLVAQRRLEEKDLKDHATPTDWDEYGGWKEGPQLAATGFFRAEKRDGKWWLVTPGGRLFWSAGIDCVNAGEPTPLRDRERYFRNLPQADEPLAQFYGTGAWAPVGYYEKRTPYRTYDFARANLFRKYGEDWRRTYAEMAHRRLRGWGLNTIGNWSDAAVYRLQRTPYTATLSNSARVIEGSSGYWGKFMDVFDPGFRQAVRENMERQRAAAADPWCIGFFVDNELSWGDETSLAVASLVSPADQPAKRAFVDDLKAKYGSVDKLNEAWGSRHESWDALLQSRQQPDLKKAEPDLQAFYTRLAETYSRIVRDEVKRVAPNHLYLGCRFAWINDRALRAAAPYCDVLSCNIYEYDVRRVAPPKDVDRPVLIGEFHFGALDRGMFHTGLKATRDQADRAAKYTDYVKDALRHPLIVGAHWFQYQDQPTTGRGDGENYQIGFVDICDRPYPEIVQASRQLGEHLYELRSGGK